MPPRSGLLRYPRSYVLALSGYGDADMINFFDETRQFIVPRAARKPSVGKQLTNLAKATGAKAVVPFWSFHQYQRADSIWAQDYTTPMEAFSQGLSSDITYIPPYSSIDCRDGSIQSYEAKKLDVEVKSPESFGDSWADPLDGDDQKVIDAYFARKDRVQSYFGFVNFRVGGRDHAIKLRGPAHRGITFAVPRASLMTAINYRIFDDLLIGNFIKTTLHGVKSLQDGQFNYYTAKFRRQRTGRNRCRAPSVPCRISPARRSRLHSQFV